VGSSTSTSERHTSDSFARPDQAASEGCVYCASARKGSTEVRFLGATHISFALLSHDVQAGNNNNPATALLRLQPYGYKVYLFPVAWAMNTPDNKEEVRSAILHYLNVLCLSTINGLNMRVMERTPVPHPDGPITRDVIQKVSGSSTEPHRASLTKLRATGHGLRLDGGWS
jgi:hypothetical protein